MLDSLFSPHSFRVGFITSATFKSINIQVESVNQVTSRIANWTPNSKVQMGYIKKALHRFLFCNNVVMGKEYFVDTFDISSVIFHELADTLQIRWSNETNFKSLQSFVNKATFYKKKKNSFWNKERQKS